ncbi:MAG: hypothetical protein HY466_02570 [Deltaproteobacteria bacterium]|nr:hypothetical protein [Deltaproteobacteria bacterium]
MIWNWFLKRRSILELLRQVAAGLPLKEVRVHRLPSPTVAGEYFGFPLVLEGSRKKEGYRFLATVALPQKLSGRIFLMHERRKASFKPVASLKWVTTTHARFNQNYLLLASDEARGQAVFQNYLCGRITALPVFEWEMDIHGEAAHFEILEPRLNASQLCEVLKMGVEVLNAVLVAEAVKPEGQKEQG